MTTIDISPEAVETLAQAFDVLEYPQTAITIRALSAALTKLQQAQTYRYIGKDMKTVLARDLEDQRDEALAALTRSRAETAAAYERAADVAYFRNWSITGDMIRALATPDQSSALAAIEAAAEARGMRKAAEICSTHGVLGGPIKNPYADWKIHADNLTETILAAIPQGDTPND